MLNKLITEKSLFSIFTQLGFIGLGPILRDDKTNLNKINRNYELVNVSFYHIDNNNNNRKWKIPKYFEYR